MFLVCGSGVNIVNLSVVDVGKEVYWLLSDSNDFNFSLLNWRCSLFPAQNSIFVDCLAFPRLVLIFSSSRMLERLWHTLVIISFSPARGLITACGSSIFPIHRVMNQTKFETSLVTSDIFLFQLEGVHWTLRRILLRRGRELFIFMAGGRRYRWKPGRTPIHLHIFFVFFKGFLVHQYFFFVPFVYFWLTLSNYHSILAITTLTNRL